MKLETYTLWVLSTGHLSKETADKLTDHTDLVQEDWACTIWKGEYGWAINSRLASEPEIIEDFDARLPEDLRTVLQMARDRDITWVMFDRDGSHVEGLPVFNW